ncbi:MAG: transposase [Xenococcaceae cyanobacterium]
MSGVLKIEIVESEATLKKLLTQQKSAKTVERVQVIYWLKTNQANSVGHLAVMVGRHRTTVSRWLSKYRQGGLEALLTIESSPGRTATIPPEVLTKLKEELSDPEGFSSYGEIQTWLETVCDVKVSYKVVHDTVRYRLKAKLKVPRPVNIKQKKGAIENFKKRTARAEVSSA